MSKNTFYFILLGLTVFRIWIAAQVGLGVDEAHYYLYGKYFAWSYFDHPPLVGWIHHLFQYLPFTNDITARLPAICNSLLTSWLTYTFLIKRGLAPTSARIGVIALNSTLLFQLLSLMFLPDSLLMPLSLLVIEATENASEKNSIQSWLKLGFWLGLSALSKYTAVFFVIAIGIYFLRQKRYIKLFNGNWIFGVLLTLLMLFPVLYWNIQNDFISFKYQSDHIFSFEKLSIISFFQSQIAQMLLWGIGFYFIAIDSMKKSISFNSEFSQILATSLFVIFSIVSLSQFLLPHWLLITFTILIPLSVGIWYETKSQKIIMVLLFISSLISFLIFAELGFHYLPKSMAPQIYKQIVQWDLLVENANKKLNEIPSQHKALAVVNWSLGSRTIYYNTKNSLVFVLDNKINQFDIWNQQSPIGYDFLILIEDEKIAETLPTLNCKSIEPIGHHNSEIKNTIVNQFTFFKCLNFGGLK